MILTKDKKILIVGLGLIGGSYATILSKKGYEVGAITLNQEDIDYAIENKNRYSQRQCVKTQHAPKSFCITSGGIPQKDGAKPLYQII